jgi:exodeoxyribonuclease VII large subunit
METLSMSDDDLYVDQRAQQQPLSVSELTDHIKGLLEGAFPSVWVSGEVSNFARPRSGHCYLTLKDESAQLSAVIWRGVASHVPFDLHDGLEVVCRGYLSLYGPQGRYQLVIQEIEPKGIGALELALRQLRAKLAREGLFDPAHKRPLPRFARQIAVVTSPTGAAIRDFLEVLRRRWRLTDVLIVPVRVQGEGSAQEIAAAIEQVNRLNRRIDCLIVTRGGGSLEDLWSFNEEVVCRAIYASRIPVISAIGHEIDVTLSDLVADVRALTPSEAAERITPASDEMQARLEQYRRHLVNALRSRAVTARSRLDSLATHRAFRRPFERVQLLTRRLDELGAAADRAIRGQVRDARHRLDTLTASLDSLSPLGVLGRGYSLTQRVSDGRLVRDARDLVPGDQLRTRFAHGEALSRVEHIEPEIPSPSGRGPG